MVASALARPAAQNPSGEWNKRFASDLQTSLQRLIGDDIPCIFTGSRDFDGLIRMYRRRTEGNMRFTDRAGMCVGDEPAWHAKSRRRHALKQKKKREERRKMRAAEGLPPTSRKHHRKLRKRPRRLARSLRQRQQAQASQPPDHVGKAPAQES
jgi:hypothetical protein